MHLPRKMKKKKTLGYIWGLWGIAGIMSVAVILSVRYFPLLLKSHTNAQSVVGLGEYGDIYGGLNTLFTGLAFVGLVVTILLQRQEMKETREEFEEQTKQFEEQTRLLNEQIEEQKTYNREQKELMILQQNKEEVYRRLDYLSKLEESVVIKIFDTKFECMGVEGPEYKRVYRETLKGAAALEKIYVYSQEPFWYIADEQTCEDVANIHAHLMSVFMARSSLIPWLQCFSDLVEDVNKHLSFSCVDVAKYNRLVFNSCSPLKLELIYLYCNVEVDAPLVQVILENGMHNIRMPHVASHPRYEKEMLKKMIHLQLKYAEAKKMWKEHYSNG